MAEKQVHKAATGTCFSSFAFCLKSRFLCNAFIIFAFALSPHSVSISHPFISFLSHLVLLSFCSSINLFALVRLADTVNSHCFSTPTVTPWPGYTIRSSLLANTQSKRQTKTVWAFFLFCCVQLASIILSLPLPRHFLSKKRL